MEIVMYLKPIVLSVEHKEKLDKFDCGVSDLNTWVKNIALNNQLRGASRTYVSLSSDGHIAGFFCISNAIIEHESLSSSKRRNMPKPIPCCLLGRLAVNKKDQGNKLGAALVMEALRITLEVSRMSGCWAMIVQPKGEDQVNVYEHLGFRKCTRTDIPTMFFEVSAIEKLFSY